MSDKNDKLDTALIRELAAILREADLGEIELQRGDLMIRVAKAGEAPVSVAASVPTQIAAASPIIAAPAIVAPAAATNVNAVKSPMVGTAYLRPDPESDNFVKVGDNVSEGQTLLLVEAMKTFNPVTAPKSGTVKTIYVENEQPVEYGEPLLLIE